MVNKKLKKLLPLFVIEEPTTTRHGINEYRRARRKLDMWEKNDWFKLDSSLKQLEKDVTKCLKELELL